MQRHGIEIWMLTATTKRRRTHWPRRWHCITVRAYPDGEGGGDSAVAERGQEILAMVGDGINDSAALARADVSIAMGKGSDIAMDVAQMTIISGDLLKIPAAIRPSEQTVRTIHQNLSGHSSTNVIAIPVAAWRALSIYRFPLNWDDCGSRHGHEQCQRGHQQSAAGSEKPGNVFPSSQTKRHERIEEMRLLSLKRTSVWSQQQELQPFLQSFEAHGIEGGL